VIHGVCIIFTTTTINNNNNTIHNKRSVYFDSGSHDGATGVVRLPMTTALDTDDNTHSKKPPAFTLRDGRIFDGKTHYNHLMHN
jgi:hypothetical protein